MRPIQAFEQFKKEFPYSQIFEQQDSITFRYMYKKVLDVSVELAERIIAKRGLPLVIVTEERKGESLPLILTIKFRYEQQHGD